MDLNKLNIINISWGSVATAIIDHPLTVVSSLGIIFIVYWGIRASNTHNHPLTINTKSRFSTFKVLSVKAQVAPLLPHSSGTKRSTASDLETRVMEDLKQSSLDSAWIFERSIKEERTPDAIRQGFSGLYFVLLALEAKIGPKTELVKTANRFIEVLSFFIGDLPERDMSHKYNDWLATLSESPSKNYILTLKELTIDFHHNVQPMELHLDEDLSAIQIRALMQQNEARMVEAWRPTVTRTLRGLSNLYWFVLLSGEGPNRLSSVTTEISETCKYIRHVNEKQTKSIALVIKKIETYELPSEEPTAHIMSQREFMEQMRDFSGEIAKIRRDFASKMQK